LLLILFPILLFILLDEGTRWEQALKRSEIRSKTKIRKMIKSRMKIKSKICLDALPVMLRA
jgi:hypothetical protein